MFISRSSVLSRVDGGGRALAELFEGNARRLAHAWRVACDQAGEGIEANRVELARQSDERERERVEQEIKSRTSSFREATAANRGAGGKTTSSTWGGQHSRDAGPKAIDLGPPRTLVDTNSLEIVDPQGRIEKGTSPTRRQGSRSQRLVDPKQVSTPPRNRSPFVDIPTRTRRTLGWILLGSC